MKVTLIGALAIAGVIVLLVLLVRSHRDQSPEDGNKL
jgi:hypothetical protein